MCTPSWPVLHSQQKDVRSLTPCIHLQARISTSHTHTSVCFPRTQIGDDSGTVQSFEMKRGEAQSIFAFRFSEGSGIEGGTGGGGGGGCGTGTDVMVKAVVMGGVEAGTGGGDRVFVTQVRAVIDHSMVETLAPVVFALKANELQGSDHHKWRKLLKVTRGLIVIVLDL